MKSLLAVVTLMAVVAYGTNYLAKQFDTSDIAAARRAREDLMKHAGE